MDDSIRVMVEVGKKKRVVAVAFDWPGWDRSARTEEAALRVLEAHRYVETWHKAGNVVLTIATDSH